MKFFYILLALFWFGNLGDWLSTYFSLNVGNIELNPFFEGFLQGNIWFFLLFKIFIGFVISISLYILIKDLNYNDYIYNMYEDKSIIFFETLFLNIAYILIYFFLIEFSILFFYLIDHNLSITF